MAPKRQSAALPKPMLELKKLLGDQELTPTTIAALPKAARNRAFSSLNTVLKSDDVARAEYNGLPDCEQR